MQNVTIVGAGKVGGALAIALSRIGYRIDELIVRRSQTATALKKKYLADTKISVWPNVEQIPSKIILITTGDPEIEAVANYLRPLAQKGQVVFHTSGSLSSSALLILKSAGCDTGSLHPLVSVSDAVRGAKLFKDSYFCIEGTPSAVRTGKQIVRFLGGKSFTIDADKKSLYHAAAVMSAGHVTSLFDVAVEALEKCGISQPEARKILFPLLASTAENLRHQTPEKALTGSFARLDQAAFESHISALQKIGNKEILGLYIALGERSLDIVQRRSGKSPQLTRFRKSISMAKRKTK